MDEYAGRVLAERYRLPVRPLGDDDFTETRAFDTYSGQEVLLRQVPLPEVVEAEVVGAEATGYAGGPGGGPGAGRAGAVADRSPRDPVVRRALEAATTVAQLPDHPRLEQVFDVFVQDGSLWVVGELLAARPLAALLAERPLSPHRAAEIAADLLTALRVLHADGRLHRNITTRTVLICEDGRAILTGLAAGAAQEALCGYDSPAEAEAETGGGVSLAKPAGADGATAAVATTTGYGRPTTALAAERARQVRLTVVGPVTERWAPEQAGPVREDGQVPPRLGPATDLWAVGALLCRSVQGHPPFPEDSVVELAELVCSEPPVVAGECGALRPVVESLLRPDPADRPDFEELHGWLRSLIRTAPEPEVGSRLVTMPALEQGGGPRWLPIVRRRGELVHHGRHKRTRTAHRERSAQPGRDGVRTAAAAPAPPPPRTPGPRRAARPAEQTFPLAPPPRQPRPPKQPKPLRAPRPARTVRSAGPAGRARTSERDLYEQQMLGQVDVDTAARPARPVRGGPRNLGRLLLTAILLLLVCAVIYAMAFMPKAGQGARAGRHGADRTATSGAAPDGSPTPSGDADGGTPGSGDPQPTESADLAKGFALRTDPSGFRIAVREGWQRRGANGQGQVRYVGGDYELLVVPGRDTTARFGADPMAYLQDKEPELAPYRGSGWATASGLRRTDVGPTAMAEGTFSWRDSSGREVYVRNLAMIHQGRYHLVLVIGPDTGRQEVDRLYEQATRSYAPR
ncbi:protein kinase [Streptomyces sp. NPDC048506]|uniref:protein kinase n=1 Tax=Streptomyces sp. NPDC048506 TaxID=3155028 RepID=UPI0034188398